VSEQEFVPTSRLEQALSKAKREPETTGAFLGELLRSQVVVLASEDAGPAPDSTATGNLLVLTNAAGGSVVPVFTTRERANPWHEREPRFQYGLFIGAASLIEGLGSGMGIVVNPGHAAGVEIPPEVIAEIKRQRSTSRTDS